MGKPPFGHLEKRDVSPSEAPTGFVAADSVDAPCRIHDLRHTHAAWLIAAGEHPKSIQTRLGHSSIQVTIDRYGHLMDGLDHQTAARLDAIAATVRGPGVAQDPPELSL